MNLSNIFFRLSAVVLLAVTFSTFHACNETSGETQQAQPTTTIHEATFLGNVKEVKAHIAAGTDLNAPDDYGSSPLIIATTFGKTEIALLLIDAGVDLQQAGNNNATPLHTAAFLCRTEIVKSLLDHGADPNVTDDFGSTPLASVEAPFDAVRPIYDELSKNLGPLGLKLDYDRLEANRPLVAGMIRAAQQ